MGSIQRVAASAVHAVAEANFSLLQANADFALVKYEIPAELLPLGERLSKQRRQVAEKGSFNIFARRLGFLFEEILPTVPALLKAYGTRASEIACEIDATRNAPKSIVDALLMHLLACMLARIWSAQEATAIWAEIIDTRRQKIKDNAPENGKASSLFAQHAAIYDVEWSTIQSWDASARAWLQIADSSSHRMQQKQIELIANNLSVAIQTQVTPHGACLSASGGGTLYDSVMLNFCSALSTLDNLILGKPQRILDGGVLLGLTSWHVYPDLVILGPKAQDKPQLDPLVAHGGIATLSIAYQEDPHGNQDGVYWSLPLAHLRYYRPVQRKRSSLHDSKISFTGLQALILGASLDSLDTLSTAAAIIKSLWLFSYNAYQDELRGLATKWNLEPKSLRKLALQLIRYGANGAKGWIGNVENSQFPFFGVTDPLFLVQAIQNPFGKVELLPALFNQQRLEPEAFIIRFVQPDGTMGYASLLPESLSAGRKRDRTEFESDVAEVTCDPVPPKGEHWIFLPSKTDPPNDVPVSMEYYGLASMQPEDDQPDYVVFEDFVKEDDVEGDEKQPRTIVWDLVIGIRDEAAFRALDLVQVTKRMKHTLKTHRPNHHFSLLALGRIIDHYKRQLSHLTISMNIIKESPWFWAWTESVVKDIPVQEMMAGSQARVGHFTKLIYPCPLSREQVFASVLQFESGTVSVGTEEMDPVMAISSGNSLFIAQRILNDPIPPDGLPSCAVAHVIGNVGKPGIALLFAPEEPWIREHDVEKWQVVNHHPFDGSSGRGMFEGSSLHMSFTGWEGPLRVRGPSAFKGMEAYNLETRISMYDGADWVADLNILKSLKESPNLGTLGIYTKSCSHDHSVQSCEVGFVSIDCWEELLSPAEKPMVLRSGSSWMARLTAVSIAHSKGFKCFLLPTHKEFCWTCVVEQSDILKSPAQRALFIY
ncbi:hypothetical protein BJX68DRAFT_279966 [Aspergillus pseudodeflectus]|uniref:Uncharacterized protein n=1 Tax=Aspergillus pseudodeflectus TaxID=176178 RepID=A0ABR4KTI0_9EURO